MTLPAENRIEHYRRAVANTEGWFEPSLLQVILSMGEAQAAASCNGWLVEWGVHHGRGLAALALAAGPGDFVLGLDCFDRQEFNPCGSGKGSLAATQSTLARVLGPNHAVQLHCADLRSLRAAEMTELLGTLPGGSLPIRIAHIDGDHTEHGAMNDLCCASATMAPPGVMLLDDVFNPDWPEVGAAFHCFLSKYSSWRAVGWAYGRALLCHDAFASCLRELLKRFPYKKAVLRGQPFIVLEWG